MCAIAPAPTERILVNTGVRYEGDTLASANKNNGPLSTYRPGWSEETAEEMIPLGCAWPYKRAEQYPVRPLSWLSGGSSLEGAVATTSYGYSGALKYWK